ncbi:MULTISPECIES: hypothetical protein [Flavobacterium]|uniref:Uncharacterized protein n=1 Tax=Flavobacterium keumense TaxID=1306518 RepID=A0ABY8N3M7_9FLAO|nr:MULTISPECIES: hypothetical protein [Flavobacterium]WGK94255.1 hypothetical protein MG292_09230 [Flavobacterium keumense]
MKMFFKNKKKKPQQMQVRFTPTQRIEIAKKLKIARFNRLTTALLKEKGVSADEKARLIVQIKKKLQIK